MLLQLINMCGMPILTWSIQNNSEGICAHKHILHICIARIFSFTTCKDCGANFHFFFLENISERSVGLKIRSSFIRDMGKYEQHYMKDFQNLDYLQGVILLQAY